jgi:hypothetical protein
MNRPPEPRPTVEIEPRVRASGGSPATVRLIIRNEAAGPRDLLVTVMGVDAAWSPLPSRSGIVDAGAAVATQIVLIAAIGTLPGRYPFAVAVQALDPLTDEATSPATMTECELVVDAPGKIEVSLTPADATAVFRKRIAITIRNTGSVEAEVDLEARHPESIRLDLDPDNVTVAANESRQVRGRIRVTPSRAFGHRERHAYTITARSAGAPRHVQGAVTGRAMFGPGSTKGVALLAIVAAWIALAIVFVPRLSTSVRNRAAADQSASTSAGGSGSPSGNTGGGTTVPGGPKVPGSGASATSVRLNGTVSGIDPNGVSVAMHRTRLVDEEAQVDAPHRVGSSADSVHAFGMIPQSALTPSTSSPGSRPARMTTHPDGAWSFTHVSAPGYYLVTFSKPGYTTQRYVIDAATAAAAQPLKVTMLPAEGRLSGVVLGPGGRAVGGAEITITDGTNTFTSSSNTKGQVGAWFVRGLSTPSSYLVSAAKNGLGLESKLVPLAGGDHAFVTLRLKAGVAALTGSVTDPNDTASPGIGGATVTVTDGTITRAATTVTGALAGHFELPDLPVPATYVVTVSAEGYQPQTRSIHLHKGQSSKELAVELTSSAGTVWGKVKGDELSKDPDAPPGAPEPKAGAGLTLTSAKHSYKITTASDGGYEFDGVAPGTYLLSAQYAGLRTDYQTVKARAGFRVTADFVLHKEDVTFANAGISGYVAAALSPSGSLCGSNQDPCPQITFTVTSSTTNDVVALKSDTQTTSSSGPTHYDLVALDSTKLPPGEYRLTVKVPGYLPATINVQVPLDAVANAPQLSLYPANTISGTLSGLSSISADPYDSAKTYTNCVWAVPVDQTIPISCTEKAPDYRACSDSGKPAAEYVPVDPATGAYTLGGLCDGSYIVTVVIGNPYFTAPLPVASQSVSHGQTLSFSPPVPRLGRAVLNLSSFSGASNIVSRLPDGVSVEATCSQVPLIFDDSTPPKQVLPTQLTNTEGQVKIWGLRTGVPVTCTADLGDGRTGTVDGVVGAVDHDIPASITVSKPSGPAFGKVTSTWRTTRDEAVSGATVDIAGPIGYSGTTAQQGAVRVTTNDQGCFAVVPDGYDVSTLSAPGCGTFAATNAAAPKNVAGDPASFVTAAVNVSVSQPGFTSLSNQAVTLGETSATQLTMRPLPATFRGSLLLAPASGTDLTATSIQVDARNAPGAGSIQAFADAGGVLHWIDSNIGRTDSIWPGTYKLTVSLTGFQSTSATYDLVCGLGPGTCSPSPSPAGAPGQITLTQLGTLTGTVTGFLGSDTLPTTPSQPIAAASVVLTKCKDATCTDFTTTVLRTTTNTSGEYTFAAAAGAGVLTRGSWRLQVLSPGWHASSSSGETETHTIVIPDSALTVQELNVTEPVNMLVDLVTVRVTLTVGPTVYNPGCGAPPPNTVTVGCPRVELVPVRTSIPIAPDGGGPPTADGVYVFSNIIPLSSYWVNVDDPSGTLKPTSLSVPILLPATVGQSQSVPVPIELTRNTLSGSVYGQQGKSGGSKALNGIPVELGSGPTPADFIVRNGTDGAPLTMQTGSAAVGGTAGAFSFNTVPNGFYSALYNDPRATGYDPTYATMVSNDAIGVFGGQSGSFVRATLALSTANVVVTLTPPDGDDVSAATLVLTETTDPTWTVSPTGPTTSGGAYSWTFNQVPASKWTLSVTLPPEHFGTVAAVGAAPAMTCSVGTSTAPVTCTSADMTVKNQDRTLGYTVNEFALGLSVLGVRLPSDPSATLPATAVLTVKDSAATPRTVYSDDTFAVSSTAPSPATHTIWGRSGTVYTATATTSLANWLSGQQSLNLGAPSTPVSITEIGASVTVHVTLNGSALPGTLTADVTLVPPAGSGITAPATKPTGGGDNVTFTGVPFGASWSAGATTIVRQGSPPANVTVTGATTFTISDANATCTGTGSAVTCSVPTVTVDMT